MAMLRAEFERLEETAFLIKRHPYYPGKESVIDDCLEDIDERCRLGRISADERDRLKDILLEPVVS